MTTLDDTDLARIRRRTGANDTAELSDTEIQYHYDLAMTDAPSSTLILPYTYVYVLRDLWGIRSIEVDRNTDHGDHETRSQKRDGTKALLDYWEKYTGLTSGMSAGLQIGTVNTNVDYTCTDFQEELTNGDFFNG